MGMRKVLAVAALIGALVGGGAMPASAGTSPCQGRIDALCAWTSNGVTRFCYVYVNAAPNAVVCVESPPIVL